jgi:hypothetical protein
MGGSGYSTVAGTCIRVLIVDVSKQVFGLISNVERRRGQRRKIIPSRRLLRENLRYFGFSMNHFEIKLLAEGMVSVGSGFDRVRFNDGELLLSRV